MTTRYKIRQNLISIGDDFWIENGEGQRVFKVDGKVLRLRETLVFEDMNGQPLCTIRERPVFIAWAMKDIAFRQEILDTPILTPA